MDADFLGGGLASFLALNGFPFFFVSVFFTVFDLDGVFFFGEVFVSFLVLLVFVLAAFVTSFFVLDLLADVLLVDPVFFLLDFFVVLLDFDTLITSQSNTTSSHQHAVI